MIYNDHDICIDSRGKIYSIEDFFIFRKNGIEITPLCLFCKNKLFPRCEHSIKRRSHFCHYSSTSCSSINYADRFSSHISNPATLLEIENLKVLFILYFNVIFEQVNSFLIKKLSPQKFLEIVLTLPTNSFKCKDMTVSSYIYIILNCITLNPNETFLLGTTDSSNQLWEFNGSKDILYKIDFTNKVILKEYPVNYNLLNSYKPKYSSLFLNLTFSELSSYLNLSSDLLDILLKTILKNYIV